jgi:hypothetical protein
MPPYRRRLSLALEVAEKAQRADYSADLDRFRSGYL